MKPSRILYVCWVFTILFGILMVFRYMNYSNSKEIARKANYPPTILLWHPTRWDSRPSLDINLHKCCGGCRFTNIKASYDDADIIVLFGDFTRKRENFPLNRVRSPNQKYVFWTSENPYHSKHMPHAKEVLQYVDAQFNLTMTYRRDSDVIATYGRWERKRDTKESLKKKLYRKSKVAVMLASDCRRFGAKLRKNYSDELVKNGLKLERYGDCFNARYEGDLAIILRPFKFFLAFENAIHCRDYITEKLWTRSFKMGLVPIVWGPSKEDIARVAPPKSYIHVEDFPTPKELVKYIKYLDRNKTAYMEYMEWRLLTPKNVKKDPCNNVERSSQPNSFRFCDLCRKAISHPGTSIIPSLTEWWYGTENRECLMGDESEISKEMSRKLSRLVPEWG